MSTRIICITMSAEDRQKELALMDWQARQIRELRMAAANSDSPDAPRAQARRNWSLYETMRDLAIERWQEIVHLRADNARLRRLLAARPEFVATVKKCALNDQLRAQA